MSSIKGYKCPHCYYYMWEGKEFYECEFQDKVDVLLKTLQEIKAIAEAPKPFINFSKTKTATEVEYDYAAICNELELRLHKVLDLITKAESDG